MKKPYYNWYASDFLGSGFVQGLEPLEEFCYRRLLDIQATAPDRRISCDVGVLRMQCKGIPIGTFQKIWDRIKAKFPAHPDGAGGLANTRLHEILLDMDGYQSGQSRNGKLGAEKRWNKGRPIGSAIGDAIGSAIGDAIGSAIGKPNSEVHSETITSTSTSNSKGNINPPSPVDFSGKSKPSGGISSGNGHGPGERGGAKHDRRHWCSGCEVPHEWQCEREDCFMTRGVSCPEFMKAYNERHAVKS